MNVRAVQLLQAWLTNNGLSRIGTPSEDEHDFAAVIQPIARGMLDLAQSPLADTRVWVAEPAHPDSSPVLANPFEWHLDTQAPAVIALTQDNWEYAPGTVDVRMLVLRSHGERASLSVILPYRRGDATSDAAFTALHINREGSTYVQSCNPSIEPLPYLLDLAGISTKPSGVICTANGGVADVSDHEIGFPGAANSLMKELSRLGEELTDWVDRQNP